MSTPTPDAASALSREIAEQIVETLPLGPFGGARKQRHDDIAALLRKHLEPLCRDRERLIEELGLISDTCDNGLCALMLPLPDSIHKEGLQGIVEKVKRVAIAARADNLEARK